jgi:hypothetical protein
VTKNRARGNTPVAQLRAISKWRAADKHTGIDNDRGVPYTYQHIDGRAWPRPRADVYRIETYIPFAAPRPLHRDVYYVPGAKLDRFFDHWDEHATTIIDIRPLTIDEAIEELSSFREEAEHVAAGDRNDRRHLRAQVLWIEIVR